MLHPYVPMLVLNGTHCLFDGVNPLGYLIFLFLFCYVCANGQIHNLSKKSHLYVGVTIYACARAHQLLKDIFVLFIDI